ncbi:MAG: DUF2207 domain-containing protein, partial [Pseudomonadota bacterium]
MKPVPVPLCGLLARVPALLILLLALAFALAVAAPQTALGAEEILFFESIVQVHEDGRLTVTETIRVRAEGAKIRRGIYRDFPTTYENRLGEKVRVGFSVKDVRRDGRTEPFHTEDRENGVRVYMGKKAVLLSPGEYEYLFTYETDRQIGFFEDFDELYWNVTGNDWAFPILRAEAWVQLPRGGGARVVRQAAYTGPAGARGENFTYEEPEPGLAHFTATRRLAPGEGLTVAVAWPKGLVAEPGPGDKAAHLLADYRYWFLAMLLPLVVLGYYLLAWNKVGRDPEKGVIVPLFEPPKDLSPAGARFLSRMGFDQKAFAAAVVDMAVKGFLIIEEKGRGDYTLVRTNQPAMDRLSPEEKAVVTDLFGGLSQLDLKNRNHTQISRAMEKMEKKLKARHEKFHFLPNFRYVAPGFSLSVLCLLVLAFSSRQPLGAVFMTVWLSGWTVAAFALGKAAWSMGRAGSILKAAPLAVMFLVFFTGEMGGLAAFVSMASVPAVAALAFLVGLNLAFYQWMKAPTVPGRRLMDQIEGFGLYLGVAEKDRLEILHPPEKTPELFEKYLPYALALDVEHQWSEKFADVLGRAGMDPDAGGRGSRHGYQPGWYSGNRGFSGLSTSLGSAFSGAISSSSTAPGSSSGSGGGGSSGGGGGGGGG